jgi:isocitrate dehydrogenase
MANPSAMILSGRLMFQYMGWEDAADLIHDAIEAQVQSKRVTYDVERQIEGGERIATSTYAEELVERIHDLA